MGEKVCIAVCIDGRAPLLSWLRVEWVRL